MPQKLSIFNLKVLHSFSIWPFPPLNWIHCGICGEKEAQLNAQIVNWTSNIGIESAPQLHFCLNIFIKQFSCSTLDCSNVGVVWGWGLVVALSDQSGSAEMRRGGNNLFVFTFCIFNIRFRTIRVRVLPRIPPLVSPVCIVCQCYSYFYTTHFVSAQRASYLTFLISWNVKLNALTLPPRPRHRGQRRKINFSPKIILFPIHSVAVKSI